MELQGDAGDSFETYEQASTTKIAHEIARRQLEKKLQCCSRICDGFARRLAIEHNEDWHGLREPSVRSELGFSRSH